MNMKLKVGDKVVLKYVPKWYGGSLKQNEKCVITSLPTYIPFGDPIIWVKNTEGIKAAIYLSWASPRFKNQQLLFEFME